MGNSETIKFILMLKNILEESLAELASVRNEREIHDLLRYRLMRYGVDSKARVTLSSDEYPKIELDLLCDGKFAVEVKLDSNFYDGFAQAVAARELYGLDAYVVHVFRRPVDARIVRAFSKLSRVMRVPAIVVDARSRRVVVVHG